MSAQSAIGASREPSVQAVLAERWELLDRLGEGSMGEVWRGRHRVLGHEVAIKLMKRASSGEQHLVARFLREAQIAARLRHRNIARVEDFGTSPEGQPFLVMELLRGRSLESLLNERKRLDRALVALIAQHVGAACEVAHALGVVHRDLKPENCFMVRDEDGADLVKVLDFGVAKVTDGLLVTHHGDQGTASFALLGTPVYMSPEQARGQRDIDHRSDLWSLAVMLYELLLGELPYHAETLPQLLFAITQEPITPPSALDPTLPAGVDAWALRAFDRDRDRRFQSGRELALALALCLGEPPRASLSSAPLSPRGTNIPPTVPEFAAMTLSQTPTPPTIPMRASSFEPRVFYPNASSVPSLSLPPSIARKPPARALPVAVLLAAGMLAGVLATVTFVLASSSSRPSPQSLLSSPRPLVPTPLVPTPLVPTLGTPSSAPTPVAAPSVPGPLGPALRDSGARPSVLAPPVPLGPRPLQLSRPSAQRPLPHMSPTPVYAPHSQGGNYNPDEP